MFENVIIDQNKHWENKGNFKGIERESFERFLSFAESKYIISILGVRRCGKSTLLKQFIAYLITKKKVNPKNIFFLNLENPYFSSYSKNPLYLEKILEEYQKIANPKGLVYLLFDEIQFFDKWQIFVKSKYENTGFKFIITGSNSRLLSSELITMLSGRNLVFLMYPFSFKEILKAVNIHISDEISIYSKRIEIKRAFDKYLKLGGFPEIVLAQNEEMIPEILQSYAKNIIHQDIVPRFEVKKPKDVEALFYYLVSNIAKPYTYNSLKKIFNISDKTIKEYIKHLEDAYLLFEVERFSFSLKKQINSPKKIYCVDNGFLSSFSFKFSEDKGRLLENLVFLTLKMNNEEIFYFKGKKECDFLVKKGLKIALAIQATASLNEADVKKREIEGLLEAMAELNLNEGLILTEDEEEIIKINEKTIKVMPVWKWLLE